MPAESASVGRRIQTPLPFGEADRLSRDPRGAIVFTIESNPCEVPG